MGKIISNSEINILTNRFGNNSGEPNCYIYTSKLCTCVAENSGNYDPNCTECMYGYIYGEPVEELLIRTSMNLKFMTERQVHIYQGGCRITIPKYNNKDKAVGFYTTATQGDVVVMKGDTRRDRDICQIGKRDYLLAFDVKEVLSVNEKSKEFKKDIDYKVHINQIKTEIEWLGKDVPASFYSVEFLSLVNYMVWDDMAKHRGSLDDNLPKMIMCCLRPYLESKINDIIKVNTGYERNYH